MDITLKPEQQQFIQAKLSSGKYATVDEVITEALLLLEQRDKHYQQWVEETREKVQVGIAQLERGEGIDGEEVFRELLAEVEEAKALQK